MNSMSVTVYALTHSLAWALIHSLWQGLLVYALLYAVLKALQGASANAKYNLSMIAMCAIAAWFAGTWAMQYQKLQLTAALISQYTHLNSGVPNFTHATTFIAHTTRTPTISHVLPGIEQYFPLLIGIYCIGLLLMLSRFVVNMLQVLAWRRQGLVAPPQEWDNLLTTWASQLNISRPIKLYLSTRINVPMMIGTFKPIILMPIATLNQLTTEEVETILLHELAHIRRNDYLLNILQTMAETVLFFNPFVWLISAIIRKEREHCCDDMVVARSGNPLPYAKALATLASSRMDSNNLSLAATGDNHQFLNRIKRIMEMKKTELNYSRVALLLLAILAITIGTCTFTGSKSFAQKAKTSTTDTTKKSVYRYYTVTIDSNGKKKVMLKELTEPVNDIDKGDTTFTFSKIIATDSSINGSKKIHLAFDTLQLIRTGSGYILLNEVSDDSFSNDFIRQLAKKHSDYMKTRDTNDNFFTAAMDRDLLAKLNRKFTGLAGWEGLYQYLNMTGKDIGKILEGEPRDMASHYKMLEDALSATDPQIQQDKQLQSYVAGLRLQTIMGYGHSRINQMADKMRNEGLITTDQYIIEKKNNSIYINGQRQLPYVLNEYKAYFGTKNARIRGVKKQVSGYETADADIPDDFDASKASTEDILDQMRADRLLDNSSEYKIERKNNDLYINGVKQPQSVFDKYSGHFSGNDGSSIIVSHTPPKLIK